MQFLNMKGHYLYANSTPANWFDHSRDLLKMINHFEERMPRPIVGIGHSMGTTQLWVNSTRSLPFTNAKFGVVYNSP